MKTKITQKKIIPQFFDEPHSSHKQTFKKFIQTVKPMRIISFSATPISKKVKP